MEPIIRFSPNTMTTRVARLQSEIDGLKAVISWQKAVKRGVARSKKASLSIRDVMRTLYDTRYPNATLSS
ncbi:MAG: hypothetical protein Q8L37_04020 [Candidatus Gottesmanbacteria bacterium]|nr:hypothetical protein [Candidatus Gottesmanbacteria bacterium]